MEALTRIKKLENKLSSLNYDENGNPIGIEGSEYVAITEELELLEVIL